MAVYGWIYANARIPGSRSDYHVRLCAPRLSGYEGRLTRLAESLLSTGRRYGKLREQESWFSGFLDEERQLYAVAVAGKQDRLLQMTLTGGGYRPQFCVLALVFCGSDIRLYQRKDTIFEPLKEVLREIQTTGKEEERTAHSLICLDFSDYEEAAEDGCITLEGEDEATVLLAKDEASDLPARDQTSVYNILESNGDLDQSLWRRSLQRPVMTGVVSVEDGMQLLKLFPDGIVTVLEGKALRYRPLEHGQTGDTPSRLRLAFEEEKRREEKMTDRSLQEERPQRQKPQPMDAAGRSMRADGWQEERTQGQEPQPMDAAGRSMKADDWRETAARGEEASIPQAVSIRRKVLIGAAVGLGILLGGVLHGLGVW